MYSIEEVIMISTRSLVIWRSGLLLCLVCASAVIEVRAESVQIRNSPINHTYWNLKKVIDRVYRITPEIKSIKHQIQAKYSQYRQAGKWPNPAIEIQANNRLEKAGLENGYQSNEFALNQAISITGRYKKQKLVAFAEYRYAVEKAKWNRLQLEAKASGLFYDLLVTKAKLVLAKTRLIESNQLQSIGKKRHRAGDLSQFHRDRLNIVREKAHQQLMFLDTQYKDVRNRFIDFLKLVQGQDIKTVEIKLDNTALLDKNDMTVIKRHPRYLMAKISINKKQRELSLTKASRLDDVNVRVFQERDEFNNRTDTVTGIAVNVPLPIWNTRHYAVKKADAELLRARTGLQKIERDLNSDLQNRTVRLSDLIKQTEHYQKTILIPARRVFLISKIRFKSGDAGVLTLVDSVNTYFEARDQYLNLVSAALRETIQYRLAVGVSSIPNNNISPKGKENTPKH